MHLRDLDDAVTVVVVERVVAVPLTVHRVARPLLGGAADSDEARRAAHRVDPEVDHLVGVVRGVEGDVPAEGRYVDEPRVDLQLVARVLRRADVLQQSEIRRRGRRRDRDADQRVLRLLVVVGVFHAHPVVEQLGVEAALVLRRSLGLELGVAGVVRDERGKILAHDGAVSRHAHARGVVRGQGGGGSRLHAAGAVGGAQTELIHPRGLREERFIRRQPGYARLGIEYALEFGAERAVLVGAHRGREEELVVHRDLFLDVETERLHGRGLKLRIDVARGRLIHPASTRRQRMTAGLQLIVFVDRIVGTDRRSETHPLLRVPGGCADQPRGVVADVRLVVLHVAGGEVLERRTFSDPAHGEVVDVRGIHSDGGVVLHPRERPPRGVRAGREPLQVLLAYRLHDVARRPLQIVVQWSSVDVRGGLVESGSLEAVVLHADVEEAENQVTLRHDAIVVLRVAGAHREIQLRGDAGVEVRAKVQPVLREWVEPLVPHGHLLAVEARDLEAGHLDRSGLAVHVATHEEANRVGTAAHTQPVRLAHAVVNEGVLRILQKVVGGDAVRDARRRTHRGQLAAGRRRGTRRVSPVGVHGLIVGAVVDDPVLAVHVPARRAAGASLGRDDYDSIGRVGAVESRGRRSLHDLHARDLLGVKRVEEREVRVGTGIRAVGGVAHAVYIVDGSIGETDRRRPADAHVRGATQR